MTQKKKSMSTVRRVLLGSAALGIAAWMPQALWSPLHAVGYAYAQGTQQGGGGSSATHGSGSGGGHAPGTAGSGMGRGGSSAVHGHYGQGGSTGTETGETEPSSDKKGPRYGGGETTRQPGEGTTGGRPVWAKEGIPEVELGRLSVARSPASVLNHAFDEVVSNWSTTGTTVLTLTAEGQPTLTMTVSELYSLPALEFARIVETYYSTVVRIDSPLENLALLKNLGQTGTTPLTGVTMASSDDMAAILLGSASDKEIPITTDTVTAVYTILGIPVPSGTELTTVANEAEAVRIAILAGHG